MGDFVDVVLVAYRGVVLGQVEAGFGGLLRDGVDERAEAGGRAAHAWAGETVLQHPAHRARPQTVHGGWRKGDHVGLAVRFFDGFRLFDKLRLVGMLRFSVRFHLAVDSRHIVGSRMFRKERPIVGIRGGDAMRCQQRQGLRGIARLGGIGRRMGQHASRGGDQATWVGLQSRVFAGLADRRVHACFRIGIPVAVEPFRQVAVEEVGRHMVFVEDRAYRHALIGAGERHKEAFLFGGEHRGELRVFAACGSDNVVGQSSMQHDVGELLPAEQGVARREVRPLALLERRHEY